MNLYTETEISEDIKKFEGAIVDLNIINKQVRFLKLYSEIYEKPLDGNSTVDDLKSRIDKFFMTDHVLLPPCDVFPDESFSFWVYESKEQVELILIDKVNSTKDVMNIMSQAKDHVQEICVVNIKEPEIFFAKRNVH